jgi:uncharacterized protein YgiM (DUF1202 family)
LGLALLCLLVGVPAAAQTAWVKDEVRVNLRTGAGREFRITKELQTGDRVDILARGDGWTQVRPDGGKPGWIPSGYLVTTAPARVTLREVQAEKDRLEKRVAELSAAEAELRVDGEAIRQRDAEREAEIERLTHENIRLRASSRWPERLTGAGIVLFGMIVGAIVARRSGRQRQSPHIKL